MNTLAHPAAARPATPSIVRATLTELHRRQPTLAIAALLFLLGSVPCLIALAVDPRTVNDIGVWIKPAKFFLSLSLYFATLAWCFGYLPAAEQTSRAGRYVIVAALAAGTLEMAWLLGAAVMGVPAHFNRISLAWGVAYSVAGAVALVLLSAIAVQGRMLARDRQVDLPPAFREALVLGAWLSVGTTLIAASVLSAGTGHWVGGTPSDAGGLPLMGWSRSGGDLRVAHFFALHLQQALLVAGALIVRSSLRRPVLAVRTTAALMTAFVIFTFVQALMGLPFIT